MELDEIVEKIVRNREEVYSASKAFLRGELSLEEYLRRLVRFWKEQPELIDASFTLAMRLDPVEMADKMARVLARGQLPSIARYVDEKLSKTDKKLGRWASMVLRENFKEAGEPPVPIAPVKAPEVAARVPPPKRPAGATEAAEPIPEVGPEAAVRRVSVTLPPPEVPKAEVSVAPQPQVQAPRKGIDRAAIAAAVEKAVVKVRKRSPMELYRDLDELLSRGLAGPEQPLVYLSMLMVAYLLGEVGQDSLKEYSEEYIGQLRSASGSVVRPEVRRLAMEAARLAEEREELKPMASFVQLYLSEANPGAQEVRESWYRSPSS
jgi:hypothetical protein